MSAPRLLLVDDDRLILAVLGKSLREAGYEVETADCGEVALEKAAAGFELAIVDMRMPGLSGCETASRLRREWNLPALFLSAYGDCEIVRKAVAEGALGYLVKPVDMPQIMPAIEAALARARDLDALTEARAHLERALAGGRRTSVAVGIVMERRRIGEAAAFEALRQVARSRQCKLEEVCDELVKSMEWMNQV